MLTSGMVRRIDELGRVVIPKEIRKTVRLKEGEELEIFVDEQENVVLKKHSPFSELKNLSEAFVASAEKITDSEVVVFDTGKIVAASDKLKKQLLGREISAELDEVLRQRKKVVFRGRSCIEIAGENFVSEEQIVCPINVQGELVGGVMFFSTFGGLGTLDGKLCDFTADFFKCLKSQ